MMATGERAEAMDAQSTINDVVNSVKSEGLFDQFRKECLEEFDNMETYHQLKQSVENHVASFLAKHKFHEGLQKNKLRNDLRTHISRSEVLMNGIQCLVDEVLSLKGHSFCLAIDKQVDKFLNPVNMEEQQYIKENTADKIHPVSEYQNQAEIITYDTLQESNMENSGIGQNSEQVYGPENGNTELIGLHKQGHAEPKPNDNNNLENYEENMETEEVNMEIDEDISEESKEQKKDSNIKDIKEPQLINEEESDTSGAQFQETILSKTVEPFLGSSENLKDSENKNKSEQQSGSPVSYGLVEGDDERKNVKDCSSEGGSVEKDTELENPESQKTALNTTKVYESRNCSQEIITENLTNQDHSDISEPELDKEDISDKENETANTQTYYTGLQTEPISDDSNSLDNFDQLSASHNDSKVTLSPTGDTGVRKSTRVRKLPPKLREENSDSNESTDKKKLNKKAKNDDGAGNNITKKSKEKNGGDSRSNSTDSSQRRGRPREYDNGSSGNSSRRSSLDVTRTDPPQRKRGRPCENENKASRSNSIDLMRKRGRPSEKDRYGEKDRKRHRSSSMSSTSSSLSHHNTRTRESDERKYNYSREENLSKRSKRTMKKKQPYSPS